MEEKIAGILEEIYAIDPSLKSKEEEVVHILAENLKADPEFEPDKEFVTELKKELIEIAETEKVIPQENNHLAKYKRIIIVLGVIVISVLIIILALVKNNIHRNQNIKEDTGISAKVSVARVGEKAFGVLSDLSSQLSTQKTSSEAASNSSAAGTTSDSPRNVAPAMPLVAGSSGSSGSSTNAKMMPPYYQTYYSLVYAGGDFSQDQEKMDVLKRVTGEGSSLNAGDIASEINLGVFDFSRYDNPKISNISVFEDKDYGYRADVDFGQEIISVYKNWLKWPNAYLDCKDPDCYNRNQLSASEVPSDEEVIAASSAFLKNYNVDMTPYGTPYVDRRFMRSYADVASIVYPEELTVIYPLQIEGRDIYESYGETTGLSVSYDIRDKKVSSMYNLMTHNYQSSAYDAETDVQKIIQTAQSTNGNIYAPVDEKNKDVKKVVLELDTPILGYEHFWRYENSGQNSEFMVPALIFPIKDNPDTGYYGQTRIVVPLIKDFANQNGGPIVVPMMDKATATTGSASSTK